MLADGSPQDQIAAALKIDKKTLRKYYGEEIARADPNPSRAGRPSGAVNKVTAEVRTLAQQHGPRVLNLLLKIADNEDIPPQARVAACKEILDRAYGRSPQALEHKMTEVPPLTVILGVHSNG